MDETQAHLERHEAECSVRYEQLQGWIKALDKRMWRIEALMFGNIIIVASAIVAAFVQT